MAAKPSATPGRATDDASSGHLPSSHPSVHFSTEPTARPLLTMPRRPTIERQAATAAQSPAPSTQPPRHSSDYSTQEHRLKVRWPNARVRFIAEHIRARREAASAVTPRRRRGTVAHETSQAEMLASAALDSAGGGQPIADQSALDKRSIASSQLVRFILAKSNYESLERSFLHWQCGLTDRAQVVRSVPSVVSDASPSVAATYNNSDDDTMRQLAGAVGILHERVRAAADDYQEASGSSSEIALPLRLDGGVDLLFDHSAPTTLLTRHEPRFVQQNRVNVDAGAAVDDTSLPLHKLALLDAIVGGGRRLYLKGHFLDELPDLTSVAPTLTELNVSFNCLQVVARARHSEVAHLGLLNC